MTNTPEFNQMISQYVDQIEELFEYVEKESDSIIAKTHSPGGSSPASPALTRSGLHSSSNGDFGVRRAKAPTQTQCFLMGEYEYGGWGGGGGGWGGDGGQTTVNILNSVGIMTAQIINASANAAAVIIPPAAQAAGQILPPVAGAVQNVVVNLLGKNNNQPPPPSPYTQPYQAPPPPQGQWVWHNGQWVWVPAGQQPPPGSQAQPGGNTTATATSYPYQYQPGLTRSKMPQGRDEVGKPGKTRDSAARSLNSHPSIQKGYQEIDYTLQDMDKCVDGILSKLDRLAEYDC